MHEKSFKNKDAVISHSHVSILQCVLVLSLEKNLFLLEHTETKRDGKCQDKNQVHAVNASVCRDLSNSCINEPISASSMITHWQHPLALLLS